MVGLLPFIAGVALGISIGLVIAGTVLFRPKLQKAITIQLAGLTGAPTEERYRFKMGSNDKDLDQTQYEIVGYDPVGSGTNPKAMDVYFEQVKEPIKPKIALGPPPPPPDE